MPCADNSGYQCPEPDTNVESGAYLTVREAAEYLGMPVNDVLNLCRDGTFGYSRIMWTVKNRKSVWVIPVTDVEAFKRKLSDEKK